MHNNASILKLNTQKIENRMQNNQAASKFWPLFREKTQYNVKKILNMKDME